MVLAQFHDLRVHVPIDRDPVRDAGIKAPFLVLGQAFAERLLKKRLERIVVPGGPTLGRDFPQDIQTPKHPAGVSVHHKTGMTRSIQQDGVGGLFSDAGPGQKFPSHLVGGTARIQPLLHGLPTHVREVGREVNDAPGFGGGKGHRSDEFFHGFGSLPSQPVRDEQALSPKTPHRAPGLSPPALLHQDGGEDNFRWISGPPRGRVSEVRAKSSVDLMQGLGKGHGHRGQRYGMEVFWSSFFMGKFRGYSWIKSGNSLRRIRIWRR